MSKRMIISYIAVIVIFSVFFGNKANGETVNSRTGALLYSMNKYANTAGEVEVAERPGSENLKIKFFIFNKRKTPVAIKGAYYYMVMEDGTIHFLDKGPEMEIINPKSGLYKTIYKKYPKDKISGFFIKLTGEQNRKICFEYYPSIWDKIRKWVFGG